MRLFLLLALTLGLTYGLQAQSPIARAKHYNLKKGIALQGYDPVAYFTAGKAVPGNPGFTASHQRVTYLFASLENRQKFLANPAKYEPAYGGWCAYAMGKDGSKVKINPSTFKIVGGTLYLFYNQGSTNTLVDWNKDESNLKRNADTYWKGALAK